MFVSDHQARDHLADASLALDAEGRFLGLRVDSIANIGAYMCGGAGSLQTFQYPHLQGGVYNIPAVGLRIRTVMSNTTPVGVTRGPGFAEAINVIERLIDAAARQCGFDRATLRRRNMARAPMTNALGYAVDSGAFSETFDKAIEGADLPGFPPAAATVKPAASSADWALPVTSRLPAAIRRKMSTFGSRTMDRCG